MGKIRKKFCNVIFVCFKKLPDILSVSEEQKLFCWFLGGATRLHNGGDQLPRLPSTCYPPSSLLHGQKVPPTLPPNWHYWSSPGQCHQDQDFYHATLLLSCVDKKPPRLMSLDKNTLIATSGDPLLNVTVTSSLSLSPRTKIPMDHIFNSKAITCTIAHVIICHLRKST